MSNIVLSDDQQNAWDQFNNFLMDNNQKVFILTGYSGTGKTTLVTELLEAIPSVKKTLKLIDPSNDFDYELVCTATTNKAAQAFRDITGQEVHTIQSTLGLRVKSDHTDGTTSLIPNQGGTHLYKTLLFVDEASYVDNQLLNYIFKFTHDCKIVFIGDPGQLIPINTSNAPALESNYNSAHLSEVIRQIKGNPIINLATKFREVVETGNFFSFYPDNHYICHFDRKNFNEELRKEFTRSDWKHNDSKVLVWRNKTVINYNRFIRNLNTGIPDFYPGDYVTCNKYHKFPSGKVFRTDQLVQIKQISAKEYRYSIPGHVYTFENDCSAFMPDSLSQMKQVLKKARKNQDYNATSEICDKWIDIRAAYSCTINKSQGSTYDQVFIDLDDVKLCNSNDQIARMLYVAVSRARYYVTFTGDLV